MTKRLFDWFLLFVLDLPAATYYVTLSVICVAIFAFAWITHETETEETLLVHNFEAPFTSEPDSAPPAVDVREILERSAGDDYPMGKLLEQAVECLSRQICQGVVKPGSVDTSQISFEFQATGIDRDEFQSRFSDEQIEVNRWQMAHSMEVFSGRPAFVQLINSVFEPWIGSTDFRSEIKIFSRQQIDGVVLTRIVVESSGSGSDERRIQATSLWDTTWRPTGQVLKLESIQVQAQEEVVAVMGQGPLLVDCTKSILESSGCLDSQLVFGLDQWSRRIPNLDISGHHGLAIGDVNQDGLDDLYVCQPHGLPNRLLIQNADGTVEDASADSNVDILDDSRSALLIDIDNDQDQDLVVATDENLVLLSNNGKCQFQLEHVLAIGRDTTSISAADFDQDGDLDLFLCKAQESSQRRDVLAFPRQMDIADDGGRNVLLRNEEGWVFRDATEECGILLRNSYWTRSAVWNDYDNDGDLDLYLTNEFMTDQLFENQAGWFSEVSERVGLSMTARHRSVSLGEFNNDGRLDYFVATEVPLSAYRESGRRGRARETDDGPADDSQLSDLLQGESQVWLAGASDTLHPFFLRAPIFSTESAYGSTTADLNNDGLDDVVVTNGTLTRGFTEEVDELLYSNLLSAKMPVAAARKTTSLKDFGAIVVGGADDEYVLDALADDEFSSAAELTTEVSSRIESRARDVSKLVLAGYSVGAQQRNRCFLSIGELGFANFSALSGVDLPDDARAVATTDWDGDGDSDLVMTCRDGPQIRIYCNQLESTNHHLQIDLAGTESNVDAIGARVEVYVTGRDYPLVKTLLAGSGTLSQSSKRLTFGLGKHDAVERVDVTWPTGKRQSYTGLIADAHYEIVEGSPEASKSLQRRTGLKIKGQRLQKTTALPVNDRLSMFYPRPPMPRIQFCVKPGKWHTLDSVEQRPMLAVFWSRGSESEAFVKELGSRASKLIDEAVDCVAILVEPEEADELESLEFVQNFIQENKFPFPVGVAGSGVARKLEYIVGDWFHHQQPVVFPSAVLLDRRGRVCTWCSSEDFGAAKIVASIEQVDLPEQEFRDLCAPLGGQWVAPHRFAKLERLNLQLERAGYQNDRQWLADRTNDQQAFQQCQKAYVLDSQGDSIRARSFFQRAIQLDRSCIAAYLGRADLLRRLAHNQPELELDEVNRLQSAAIADFEKALELDPLNADAVLGRAKLLMDQERFPEAQEQLLGFLEQEPNRFEAHALLGRVMNGQDDYDQAVKHLTVALANRPSLPDVAVDLGRIYLKQGEYHQAGTVLRKGIQLQPSNSDLLRLLAEAEFFVGRFDEAVSLFKQVAENDPNRRRSQSVLAWLLATCPYEKHRNGADAIRIMSPILELGGEDSPSTLEIYAACLAEDGQFEEALGMQQRAVEIVVNDESSEKYSPSQERGLLSRLELYRRQRPYRTANLDQIPIHAPQNIR